MPQRIRISCKRLNINSISLNGRNVEIKARTSNLALIRKRAEMLARLESKTKEAELKERIAKAKAGKRAARRGVQLRPVYVSTSRRTPRLSPRMGRLPR